MYVQWLVARDAAPEHRVLKPLLVAELEINSIPAELDLPGPRRFHRAAAAAGRQEAGFVQPRNKLAYFKLSYHDRLLGICLFTSI